MEAGAVSALLAVTVAGAAVQAALGLGFAILAAPVFLAVIADSSAVQVLVALHLVLSMVVVPLALAHVRWPLLAWLTLGSLAGLPLGLAVFLRLDIGLLRLLIGVATLVFTAPLVWREWGPRGRDATTRAPDPAAVALRFSRPAALGVGLLSGLLTAVVVMAGPVAMLYLSALGLGKNACRSTGLAFFGVCHVLATLTHAVWGGMPGGAWRLTLLLVPGVLAGAVIGSWAAHRLSEHRFRRAIIAVLLATGLYAISAAL